MVGEEQARRAKVDHLARHTAAFKCASTTHAKTHTEPQALVTEKFTDYGSVRAVISTKKIYHIYVICCDDTTYIIIQSAALFSKNWLCLLILKKTT